MIPQSIQDFFVFIGWLFQSVIHLFGQVFLPVRFFYAFLQSLFSTAFSAPIIPEKIWSFDTQTLAVFQAVPYFNVLIYACVAGVAILFIVFILNTINQS